MTANGDVNRWELTGRMAKDAEVQESNGRKRLRLRVAVHESGPEGVTHFFTVIYFGARWQPAPARHITREEPKCVRGPALVRGEERVRWSTAGATHRRCRES